MSVEYRKEALTSISPFEYLRRVAGLPIGEILRRCGSLVWHLSKNMVVTRRLADTARSLGKTPHFVIMTQKIGDIIASETTIDELKQKNDHLIWVCESRYSNLLRWHPKIDTIVDVSSYTEAVLLSRLIQGPRWTRLGIDGTLCNRFGLKIKNPNRAQVNASNFYSFGSLADAYSLIACGKKASRHPEIYPDPRFNASAWIAESFENPGLPIFAIHLSSDEHARSWSTKGASELRSWLLSSGTKFNVLEFGLSPLIEPAKTIRHVGGEYPLSTQAALLKHATIFIGVDSGFAHMANALAVPSILLLGRWGKIENYLPWRLRINDIVIRSEMQTFLIESSTAIDTILKLLSRIETVENIT